MVRQDTGHEDLERTQSGVEDPLDETAPTRIAVSEEAHQVEVDMSTTSRPAQAPIVRVEVVFSREELHRLESEAAGAGTSVAALVHELVVARPHLRVHASIGSNNLPSNPPSARETSSGVRVRGYSGAYAEGVGRNR